MNSTLIRSLFCQALLSASMAAVPATAQTLPSFDCRKAASPTEKAVCADSNLAKLDRQLATLWRSTIQAYMDEQQIAQMKLDQRHWMEARNACAANVECIGRTYHDRLSRLTGADHEYPAAGVFEVNEVGSFALYPLSGEYLVSIQTADPKNGAWTCEVDGRAKAKMDGNVLQVSFEKFSFPVTLRDSRTLVVASGEEVSAAAANACGLNGNFAFAYTRRLPEESH
jgi:uncharacterized protein